MNTSPLLPFTKMQAVGNDFVVIDEREWPAGTDWPRVAVRLCDRKFGVGSDGLMLLGESGQADLRARMFNPDGTEDMCGNGTRCVIALAVQRGYAPPSGVIETLSGNRAYSQSASGQFTVDMGQPKTDLADIPVDISAFHERFHERVSYLNLPVTVTRGNKAAWKLDGNSRVVDAINTGSTHAILWRETLPDDDTFFTWSPAIENATYLFPERTSVLWAGIESLNRIRLRIWERGVGETLGCGTGACAAAVLARMRKYVAPTGPITVASKGGELTVEWAGEGSPMLLSGPAETVYSGKVTWDG